MTEITTTNVEKYNAGNYTGVRADATSVGNTETWTVPHLKVIKKWGFTCTTDDQSGGTVSANVITIANGASIAGIIWAEGY